MGGAKARPPWAGARAPLQAAADPNSYRTDDSKKNKAIVQTSIKKKKSYVQTLLKRKAVLK
jgi:hypothetical protein